MTSVKLDPSSQPGLTSHGRNWVVAAGVLTVVGVVLVALTFALKSNEDLAGWSYTLGFLAVYAAIVSFLVGWMLGHGAKPTLLPVTLLGWVVLAAAVVSVVLIFAVPNVAGIGFTLAYAAALGGVLAVLLGGERSVPVFALPLLGALFAIAFVFGELAIGHA